MDYPVDSLATVDPEALEQSAKDCMSKLLESNPEIHKALRLPDSKEIEIDLCNVSFVPLYGADVKLKILALFSPEDRLKAVGLYLLGRWWSAEDILKTADSTRTGLLQVKTLGEKIVLYVLNRIIYRDKEKESDDVCFLCHGEHDIAKIFWKDGEAIGFYSVKSEDSLCSSYLTQRYQLPIMDSIYIRKCYRGSGYGLQMLEDFVRSFKTHSVGLKYPLSTAMYKVCKNYLRMHPEDNELLWEVRGIGGPFERTLIAKKLQKIELKGDQVTARLNFETENTDASVKKVITQGQKTMEYTTETVEEVVQIKITKEVQDTPVTTRGRSSNLKRKKTHEDTEGTTEKIIRVEDIEVGVQSPVDEPVAETVIRTANVKEADLKDVTVTVTHGEANVSHVTHVHCEQEEDLTSAPEECVMEVCPLTTESATVTPEEAVEKTELLQMTPEFAEIEKMTSIEETQIVKSFEATTNLVNLQCLEFQQVVEVDKMTSGVEEIKETKGGKYEGEEKITEIAVVAAEAKSKSDEITPLQRPRHQSELDLKPDTVQSVDSSTTEIRVLQRTGKVSTATERMSTRLHEELQVTCKQCQLKAKAAHNQNSMQRSKAVQQEESGPAEKEKEGVVDIVGDANETYGNIMETNLTNKELLSENEKMISDDVVLKGEDIKTNEKISGKENNQEQTEIHEEETSVSTALESANVKENKTSAEHLQEKTYEEQQLDVAGITTEDQETEKQKAKGGDIENIAMDKNVVCDTEDKEEKKNENMEIEEGVVADNEASVVVMSVKEKEQVEQAQDEECISYINLCEKEPEVQEPSHDNVEMNSDKWTESVEETVDLVKEVNEITEIKEASKLSHDNKEEKSSTWTELTEEQDLDLVENSGSPEKHVDKKSLSHSERVKDQSAEGELTQRVLRSATKSVKAISKRKYVRHSKAVKQQDEPEVEKKEEVMESRTAEEEKMERESQSEVESTLENESEIQDKIEAGSQNERSEAVMEVDDAEVVENAKIQVEGKPTLQSTGETVEQQEDQPATEIAQKDDEQNIVESTSVFTLQKAAVVLVDFNKVASKQTGDTEEEITEETSHEVLDQEVSKLTSTEKDREENLNKKEEMKQTESLVEPANKDQRDEIEMSTESTQSQEENRLKQGDVAEKEDAFTETCVENIQEQVVEPGVDNTLKTDSEKGESVMAEEKLKDDNVGEIALEEESAAAEEIRNESSHVETSEEETPVVTSRSLRRRTVTVTSTPQKKSKHLHKTVTKLSENENVQIAEVIDKSDKGSTEETKENKDEKMKTEDSVVSNEDNVVSEPQEEDRLKKADVPEEEDAVTEMCVEEPITENVEKQVVEPGVDNTLQTDSEKGETVMAEEKLIDDKVGEIALEEESAAAEEIRNESVTNQKEDQGSKTPDHVETPEEETPVVTSRSLRRRTVTVTSTPQRKSKYIQKTVTKLSENENVQIVEVIDKSDKSSTEETKESKDKKMETEDSVVSNEVPKLPDKDSGLMEAVQQEESLNETRSLKVVPGSEEAEFQEVSKQSHDDEKEKSNICTETIREQGSDLVESSGSPRRKTDGKRSNYATPLRRSERCKGHPAEHELTQRVLRSATKSVKAISQKHVRQSKTVKQSVESAQAADEPEVEHREDVMEFSIEVAEGEKTESRNITSEGDQEHVIAHQHNVEEENKMEKEHLEAESSDDVKEVDSQTEDGSQNESTGDVDKLADVNLDVDVVKGKTTLQLTGEDVEEQEEQPATEIAQKDDEKNIVESTSVFTLQKAAVVLVDFNKVPSKQTGDTEEEITEETSHKVLDQDMNKLTSTEEDREENLKEKEQVKQTESLGEPTERETEMSAESTQSHEDESLKQADVAEEEDAVTEMCLEESITENLQEQVVEPGVDNTLQTDSEKGESVMAEEKLKDDKVGEIALEEESAAAEDIRNESGHLETSEEETPVVTSRSLRRRTVTVTSTPQKKSKHLHKTVTELSENENVQIVIDKSDKGSTEETNEKMETADSVVSTEDIVLPHPQEENRLKQADVAEIEGEENLQEQVVEPGVDNTLQTDSEKGETVMAEEKLIDDKVGEIALEEESAAAEDIRNESGHVEMSEEETPVITSRSLRRRTVTVTSTPQRKSKHLHKTVTKLSENENVQAAEVIDKSDKGSTEETKENKDEKMETEDSVVSNEDKVISEPQEEKAEEEDATTEMCVENLQEQVVEPSVDNTLQTDSEKGESVMGEEKLNDDKVGEIALEEESTAAEEIRNESVTNQKEDQGSKTPDHVETPEEETPVVTSRSLRRRTVTVTSTPQKISKHLHKTEKKTAEHVIVHEDVAKGKVVDDEGGTNQEQVEVVEEVLALKETSALQANEETTFKTVVMSCHADETVDTNTYSAEVVKDAEIQFEGKSQEQSALKLVEEQQEESATEILIGHKAEETTAVLKLQKASVVLVDCNKVPPKQTDDSETAQSQPQEEVDQEVGKPEDEVLKQTESLVEPHEKGQADEEEVMEITESESVVITSGTTKERDNGDDEDNEDRVPQKEPVKQASNVQEVQDDEETEMAEVENTEMTAKANATKKQSERSATGTPVRRSMRLLDQPAVSELTKRVLRSTTKQVKPTTTQEYTKHTKAKKQKEEREQALDKPEDEKEEKMDLDVDEEDKIETVNVSSEGVSALEDSTEDDSKLEKYTSVHDENTVKEDIRPEPETVAENVLDEDTETTLCEDKISDIHDTDSAKDAQKEAGESTPVHSEPEEEAAAIVMAQNEDEQNAAEVSSVFTLQKAAVVLVDIKKVPSKQTGDSGTAEEMSQSQDQVVQEVDELESTKEDRDADMQTEEKAEKDQTGKTETSTETTQTQEDTDRLAADKEPVPESLEEPVLEVDTDNTLKTDSEQEASIQKHIKLKEDKVVEVTLEESTATEAEQVVTLYASESDKHQLETETSGHREIVQESLLEEETPVTTSRSLRRRTVIVTSSPQRKPRGLQKTEVEADSEKASEVKETDVNIVETTALICMAMEVDKSEKSEDNANTDGKVTCEIEKPECFLGEQEREASITKEMPDMEQKMLQEISDEHNAVMEESEEKEMRELASEPVVTVEEEATTKDEKGSEVGSTEVEHEGNENKNEGVVSLSPDNTVLEKELEIQTGSPENVVVEATEPAEMMEREVRVSENEPVKDSSIVYEIQEKKSLTELNSTEKVNILETSAAKPAQETTDEEDSDEEEELVFTKNLRRRKITVHSPMRRKSKRHYKEVVETHVEELGREVHVVKALKWTEREMMRSTGESSRSLEDKNKIRITQSKSRDQCEDAQVVTIVTSKVTTLGGQEGNMAETCAEKLEKRTDGGEVMVKGVPEEMIKGAVKETEDKKQDISQQEKVEGHQLLEETSDGDSREVEEEKQLREQEEKGDTSATEENLNGMEEVVETNRRSLRKRTVTIKSTTSKRVRKRNQGENSDQEQSEHQEQKNSESEETDGGDGEEDTNKYKEHENKSKDKNDIIVNTVQKIKTSQVEAERNTKECSTTSLTQHESFTLKLDDDDATEENQNMVEEMTASLMKSQNEAFKAIHTTDTSEEHVTDEEEDHFARPPATATPKQRSTRQSKRFVQESPGERKRKAIAELTPRRSKRLATPKFV